MEHLDNKLLILRVKERPVLWDKTLDSYKNKVLRDAAWKEIFALLNDDYKKKKTSEQEQYGKQVVKKWTQMRDNWIKSIRKHREKKRTGRLTRLYIYHKQMSFLKKVIKNRLSSGEGNTSTSDNVGEKDDTSKPNGASAEIDMLNIPSTSGVQQKRKIGKQTIISTDTTEYTSSKSNVENGNNESRHLSFFKGLLPSLSSLNDDQSLEFQAGVISLLQGIKRNAQISSQAYQFNHFLAQPAIREVSYHQNSDPFAKPRAIAEPTLTTESLEMSSDNTSIKSEHSNISSSEETNLNFDFV